MKEVQINNVKVKIFEDGEVIQKLGLTQKENDIIIKYQKDFPELLQDDMEGFVIDEEKLCKQLDIKDDFNTWLLSERVYNSKGQLKREGKLIKYKSKLNIDYITDWKTPNAKLTKKEIEAMSPQKRSANRIKKKIMLTLNCAKKIAMRQNNDKGDLVCDYFIIMEKALRKYEDWSTIRGEEKGGWNEMKTQINLWCERNNYDSTLDIFRTREANMLNQNLTGYKASELRLIMGAKDEITRDYLTSEVNKALNELQKLNCSLLMSDLDFEFRSKIIKQTCNGKYSNLYLATK